MTSSVVKWLREELHQLDDARGIARQKLVDVERDYEAVKRTLEIAEQDAAGVTISRDELKGLTQEDALILIAERAGGRLRFGVARQMLVDAGLIQNPKNAATIMYQLLNRGRQFERVSRGEYRLIGVDPSQDDAQTRPPLRVAG